MKAPIMNTVAAVQTFAIHYCVEPFENDGSLYAALLKAIKRTMAAEYSRELSAKVFAGQSRLTELGFRQGGTAGYGFRRLLVDENGSPKVLLNLGEQKSRFWRRDGATVSLNDVEVPI